MGRQITRAPCWWVPLPSLGHRWSRASWRDVWTGEGRAGWPGGSGLALACKPCWRGPAGLLSLASLLCTGLQTRWVGHGPPPLSLNRLWLWWGLSMCQGLAQPKRCPENEVPGEGAWLACNHTWHRFTSRVGWAALPTLVYTVTAAGGDGESRRQREEHGLDGQPLCRAEAPASRASLCPGLVAER